MNDWNRNDLGEPWRKPVATVYLGVMRIIDVLDDFIAHGRHSRRVVVFLALFVLFLSYLFRR
jgi:hypothetical protein